MQREEEAHSGVSRRCQGVSVRRVALSVNTMYTIYTYKNVTKEVEGAGRGYRMGDKEKYVCYIDNVT